jgi:DNA (cytosine-5)-methyltransferase 1
MPNKKHTVASLFSGCGGFDLGFVSNGFKLQAAYDSDPIAVQNFSKNVCTKVRQADLRSGIPDEHKLRGLDVLIAGPPCQGFSTAGKRELNDERNHLLPLTGELALRVNPKVLVVENVSGVLSGEHAKYMNALDGMMRENGYSTHSMRCQVSDIGMAQLRRRILFFAWRTGCDIDFAVEKTSANNLRSVLKGLGGAPNHNPRMLIQQSKDWLIARKILQGQKLSNVRGGSKAIATWDIPEVFGIISEHERTVLEMLRRLRRQSRQRVNGDADPVSIERLERALGLRFHSLIESLIKKGFVRRIGEKIDLVGTFNGKYRRLSWDKPSCTVDTRFGAPRYFLHPSQQRGFTVREAARIQGFDDSYIFSGSEQAQYRMIGNAVPPPLGSIAATMSKRLLGAL